MGLYAQKMFEACGVCAVFVCGDQDQGVLSGLVEGDLALNSPYGMDEGGRESDGLGAACL